MPRKHPPVKHIPYTFTRNEGGKTRYSSKAAAEKAAELRMLEHPKLDLTVYQALDGGWYLTSKSDTQ